MHPSTNDFIKNGPKLNGRYILEKVDGHFCLPICRSFDLLISHQIAALNKIADALNRNDYAMAAIYFSHYEKTIFSDSLKREAKGSLRRHASRIDNDLDKKFDDSEARDEKGRWTTGRSSSDTAILGPTGPIDPMCMIHKKRCHVSCYDTLPTGDFGFRFFNCVNSCMDAVGCLGRA